MNQLIGHQAIQQQLHSRVATGKLPHALLFHGPQGVGKHTCARQLIAHLLCGGTATPDLSANTGSPLFPVLQAGSQPGLFTLTPTDRKTISVEATRHTIQQLALSAETWRVLVIDAVEDLTSSAANALLKTLEEPLPATLMILLSHQPWRLLPTLRSRCQTYAFNPLTDQVGQAVLANLAAAPDGPSLASLQQAWPFAGGRPGYALQLAQLPPAALAAWQKFCQQPQGWHPTALHTLAQTLHELVPTESIVRDWVLGFIAQQARQDQASARWATLYQHLARDFQTRQTYNINRPLLLEHSLLSIVQTYQNQ